MKNIFICGGGNNIYLLLFLLSLSLFAGSAFSQTISGPGRVDLFIEYVHPLSMPDSAYLDPAAMFLHDTVLVTLVVELKNNASVSKFRVKAGKNSGSNNLIQKTFTFDGPSSMPDGTAYKRRGNVVYLTLGKFFGISQASAEVELEDSQGRKSLPVQAQFN